MLSINLGPEGTAADFPRRRYTVPYRRGKRCFCTERKWGEGDADTTGHVTGSGRRWGVWVRTMAVCRDCGKKLNGGGGLSPVRSEVARPRQGEGQPEAGEGREGWQHLQPGTMAGFAIGQKYSIRRR